jgi:ppGpp synthetase/RelA/SpoT-type nucleotidyltranferase
MSDISSEKPPWISKTRLNRAGQNLREANLEADDAEILEAWRAAHKHVLNAFQSILRNRRRQRDVVIAQRLKRRWTIADKLSREPGMQLARMDDVAGCRLIFSSIADLHVFRSEMQACRFKHARRNEVDKYDYIKHPKPTGYRSVHDIYVYDTSSMEHGALNGLMLELQYRTKAQHAWATAVEVITRITENQPKFDRGDERYKEFFRLTSEIIARTHEGCHSCYPDLSDRELLEHYVNVDGEIGVFQTLRGVAVIHSSGTTGGNVILRFTKDGDLRLHFVSRGRVPTEVYFDLEREHPDDDIVLVKADTFAEIRSAYRNYFSDTADFLAYVETGCRKLEGGANGE